MILYIIFIMENTERMLFRVFVASILCLSWLSVGAKAASDPTEIARSCGLNKVGEVQLPGAIEAAATFHRAEGRGTYFVFRASDDRLQLARWDETSGLSWQRDLELPTFVSLSTSADGELAAACTWEDESVLGFVFDQGGVQRFRQPLEPLSQLTVSPDGKAWSVTWAMFDWPGVDSAEAPTLATLPECMSGKWCKKSVAGGSTVWWYRPLHHPSETPHPALCYPAFALTDSNGAILFSEQEAGSFVTFFADVVSGEERLVLVKEGEDAVGNQAREMIALTNEGQELWRVRAHRQSSQVSGFLHGHDLILLFTGKEMEYRSADNGALIASDTLNGIPRDRLFPIQGFLQNDENFVILGRQVSIQVHLNPGEGIADCEPLEMGGALSFDGRLCVLYSTSSDSASKVCTLFQRTR
jgi:hypothetical protein